MALAGRSFGCTSMTRLDSRSPLAVLLLGLICALDGCAAPPQSLPAGPLPLAVALTSDEERNAIFEELERYYTDLSARDWQAFAAHFWEGATITTVWQPANEDAPRVVISSVREFVDKAPQGPGSKPIFEERMLGAEVRAYGDVAQAWATYEARFGDRDQVDTWHGIDAFTLSKHDGRWRIVSLAYAAE